MILLTSIYGSCTLLFNHCKKNGNPRNVSYVSEIKKTDYCLVPALFVLDPYICSFVFAARQFARKFASRAARRAAGRRFRGMVSKFLYILTVRADFRANFRRGECPWPGCKAPHAVTCSFGRFFCASR